MQNNAVIVSISQEIQYLKDHILDCNSLEADLQLVCFKIQFFIVVFISREENKVLLKELNDALEAERATEREHLQAKKMQDVERLRSEFDEELQAERTRLQKEREAKLSSLKKQVMSLPLADVFF